MPSNTARNATLVTIVLIECGAIAWFVVNAIFNGWLTATPDSTPHTRTVAQLWFVASGVSILALLATIGLWVRGPQRKSDSA